MNDFEISIFMNPTHIKDSICFFLSCPINGIMPIPWPKTLLPILANFGNKKTKKCCPFLSTRWQLTMNHCTGYVTDLDKQNEMIMHESLSTPFEANVIF